jgi:hypothetical protein
LLAENRKQADTLWKLRSKRERTRRGTGETMQQRHNDRELREQLMQLRNEHRLLDDEIVTLETSGTADQLLVRRLKKKKLVLKDQIQAVEDQLLPDIIA